MVSVAELRRPNDFSLTISSFDSADSTSTLTMRRKALSIISWEVMMVGIIFLRFSTIWRRRRMVIMPALAYLLGPMSYEVECDLLLKRDGKVVLTELEASLLRSVREVGSLQVIGKRLGMPNGDLL